MRSLSKALLDAARAKRSQSSGAAPEESNATKRALSGRLCFDVTKKAGRGYAWGLGRSIIPRFRCFAIRCPPHPGVGREFFGFILVLRAASRNSDKENPPIA